MREIGYPKIDFTLPLFVDAGDVGFEDFDATGDPIVALFLPVVKVGAVARFPRYSFPFENFFVVSVEEGEDVFDGEAVYESAKDGGDLAFARGDGFGLRVEGEGCDGIGNGLDDPDEGSFL
jgi:hypothetical protein